MKHLIPLLLCLLLMIPAAMAEEPASSLYIKAIPDLSEDFALGMDVSSVLALEAAGVDVLLPEPPPDMLPLGSTMSLT